MNTVYFSAKICFTLIICACSVVGLTRQFQMQQQNSYFLSRYFGWLKGNSSRIWINIFPVLFSMICGAYITDRVSVFHMLFAAPSHGIHAVYAFTAVFCALLITVALTAYFSASRAVKRNRQSIKPLVLTARVKRMYAVASVVAVGLGTAFVLAEGTAAFAAWCVLSLLCFAPALFASLILLLCKPAELLISRKYVREAKKILKASPSLTVIGITGSYGKTGTKFILNRLLEEGFNVTATPGSFNTPMGVVRTVRENLRPESSVFICEMGAKKRGDIKEICDIAHPQIGVITSVGPQHLDTFGSVTAVADTKFELADAANEVFLNYDNDIIRSRGDNYNAVSYGTTPDCDVYAENISYGSFGANFDIVYDGKRIPAVTRLLGRHNVLNITAAAAVAKRLGLSDNAVSYAISRLTPTPHRLELKSFINGSLLIDDAYNANPEGSLEAVNVLSSFNGKKKIIVTPGLVELGESEYKYNYELGLAAAEKCDIIILVGQKRSVPLSDAVDTTDFKKENLYTVSSFAEAMQLLSGITDKNSVTLFENDLPDNYLK